MKSFLSQLIMGKKMKLVLFSIFIVIQLSARMIPLNVCASKCEMI